MNQPIFAVLSRGADSLQFPREEILLGKKMTYLHQYTETSFRVSPSATFFGVLPRLFRVTFCRSTLVASTVRRTSRQKSSSKREKSEASSLLAFFNRCSGEQARRSSTLSSGRRFDWNQFYKNNEYEQANYHYRTARPQIKLLKWNTRHDIAKTKYPSRRWGGKGWCIGVD